MLAAKICLTGGPCGGKSTALAKIERKLTDMGYKVFIINEIATRIINSGIKPFGDDAINMMDFEYIILKEQLTEEECYERAAKLLDKKCVILCDRGIFDVKSYISEEEFDCLLKKFNKSRLNLMDGYNLVINLNTVAKGAEEFYITDNNKARSEGIKDAIIRDNKCQEAWSFHNNFKIVDNSTDFENKIGRVIDIVKDYLGIEKRIERKYLVEIKVDALKELKKKEVSNIHIEQIYLNTDKDCEMRLRKRTLDGDSTYYITVKRSKNADGKYIDEKIITEEKIDKKMYERLLNQRDVSGVVEKTRSCVVENNVLYKIDEFKDMIIMECAADAEIPSFVKVIKEVTDDCDYKNYNIAKKNNRAYIKRK